MNKSFAIFSIVSLIMCVILFSCMNEKSRNMDLSFAGITIGQDFPDSLKNGNQFEYYESTPPFYEGSRSFSLPNYPNAKIHVVASTDLNGKEVTSIQISPNNEQASDFYNMLKSKYGIPTSDYGDADCSLQYLIHNMYDNLGFSEYDCRRDISGTYVMAIWEPISTQSIIRMIADVYHFPDRFNPKIDIFLRFQYINLDRFETIKTSAERKALDKKRDDYRKQNQQTMNQDF